MTLRQRLLVSSLLAAVPVAIAMFVASEWMRERAMAQSLSRYMDAATVGDARARCEADPMAFGSGRRGGPGRGGPPPNGFPPPDRRGPQPLDPDPLQMTVYDADLRPVDPHAPALNEELGRQLASGSTAQTTFRAPDGLGVTIATRTPWPDSPCAVLVGRMQPRPGEAHDQEIALALVVATVVMAVWIAGGPVLTRMRRLRDAVGRSAESHYATAVPVDGGGELADLARAFNDAGRRVRQHLEEVETRERALREFVANTTHDVAMPLTVLQGHLAELERQTAASGQDRERVTAAIRETHYLTSLLRNLGAATRLDAGPAAVDRQPTDANALVERVVLRHQAVARAKDVSLEFAVPDPLVTIATDVTLMEQAIGNLVDNAIRYNRAGGHVAVVLDRRASDRVSITVSDDGPGVAPTDIARLTERRFRGEGARTRRPDGQGIGLSIVGEVVERLGYTLSIAPGPESGLVATISLPAES
jgi:signal transduction histidine kinase